RRVVAVGVDRRGAHLQPHAWRTLRTRNGLTDQPRRTYARLDHLAPVLLVVTAIHASTCEIDDDSGAVDLFGPIAERRAVPVNRTASDGARSATRHDDLVSALADWACQDRADAT